jgi:putative membrane protein
MSRFIKLQWSVPSAAFLFLAPSISAQTLSGQDRAFIETAASAGMMEVHMGHLGVEKGLSSEVKSLAQRLIEDHSKGNEELSTLAKQKGVTLPTGNPPVPDDLESKSGSHFDKAFTDAAVDGHEKAIKEFEKEANSGSDPDVKGWAVKTLPTLRAHLDAAKALKDLVH